MSISDIMVVILGGEKMTLNAQQLKITEQTEGAKLVIAGPGTGKTTTVCHFLAKIISNGAPPDQILAVTFTVKAAREMKSRVYKLSGQDPHVDTIHAFALQVLRKYPPPGFTEDFTVLSQDDEFKLLKHAIVRCKLSTHPQEIREKMSIARNTRNRAVLDASLSGFYDSYMTELKRRNAMDFDAMLTWCLWTFENNPLALKDFSDKYKFLLVDEFQDTSKLQYDILRLLAQTWGNILCVGDYDQSIYSFRGADVSIILNMENDFPNLQTFYLEQNYRCTKTIVSAANALISKNVRRKPKPHWTENDQGEQILQKVFSTAAEEANFVAETIADLHARGADLGDFAVLYRVHTQGLEITKSLVDKGLSYKIIGDKDYFDLQEIKNLLYFFKLAANPNDQDLMAQGLRFLGRIGAQKPKQVMEQLLAELVVQGDPVEMLQIIMEGTGYIKFLEKNTSQSGILALDNVKEMESVLAGFRDKGLAEFLAFTDRAHGVAEQDAINLLSIHASKGLEFPTVFVIGLNEGTLPHFKAQDPDEVEEERRMLYVAISRASQQLFITYPQERLAHGKSKSLRKSRFIGELYLTRANNISYPKKDLEASGPILRYSLNSKEVLKAEAETQRKANPPGPWRDSSGNRWGVCQSCGEFTKDWWSFDGKTNKCKCNDCRYRING